MIYYLGVRFTPDTNGLLHEFKLLNGLSEKKMPSLDFHTTIVYSRTPFTFDIRTLTQDPIGIVGDHLELLGSSLVLPYNTTTTDHPDASYLYDMYNITIHNGATSDHLTYLPHITIAEDCDSVPKVHRYLNIPVTLSEIFYREYPARLVTNT